VIYAWPAGTTLGSLAPREPTPLEWLDAEVDRTCALARAA
jgi:hypothetical protein